MGTTELGISDADVMDLLTGDLKEWKCITHKETIIIKVVPSERVYLRRRLSRFLEWLGGAIGP